eukprot:5300893-Amphidinium_carterae.1
MSGREVPMNSDSWYRASWNNEGGCWLQLLRPILGTIGAEWVPERRQRRRLGISPTAAGQK